MNKIYLVVSRKYDGYYSEKVKLNCTLDQAKMVGQLMLHTKAIRYEIYEDGKDYYGDIKATPVYSGDVNVL